MDPIILADLAESYGITVRHAEPVSGGWLNRKWKVGDGTRSFLVKQFSHVRFSRDRLVEIEHALQRQQVLEGCGVPCPHIVPCRGEVVRRPDAETTYMVMTFCPGKMEQPGTITSGQIRSLRLACGAMHAAFAKLPVQGVKGHPLGGATLTAALQAYHRRQVDALSADALPADAPVMNAGKADESPKFRQAVEAQEAILRNLSPAWLDRLPMGIAHEDFSADNMLFHDNAVSAILDFDRNQYSWLWHDVGRALLSLAWDGARLDAGMVSAFCAGYAESLSLTRQDVVAALRITWCLESPWWIVPERFTGEGSAKITRFRDELLWLTHRWFELDAVV